MENNQAMKISIKDFVTVMPKLSVQIPKSFDVDFDYKRFRIMIEAQNPVSAFKVKSYYILSESIQQLIYTELCKQIPTAKYINIDTISSTHINSDKFLVHNEGIVAKAYGDIDNRYLGSNTMIFSYLVDPDLGERMLISITLVTSNHAVEKATNMVVCYLPRDVVRAIKAAGKRMDCIFGECFTNLKETYFTNELTMCEQRYNKLPSNLNGAIRQVGQTAEVFNKGFLDCISFYSVNNILNDIK